MTSEARWIKQYAELVRAGHRIDIIYEQFSEATQTDLKLLIDVTKQVGGQLAPNLDRLAAVIQSREQNRTELDLAVAGPKASSRLILSLPILVFLGAGIAGIPIFKTLASPSLVWASLILGGILFWLGSRWTNRLLEKAAPRPDDPGLMYDFLALAVRAGLPVNAAKELVSSLFGEIRFSELQEIDTSTGIAVHELLLERANSLRSDQFNADRLKIQKTSVKVLWPLGLTVLPAFVLIAIIPVGTALISNQ